MQEWQQKRLREIPPVNEILSAEAAQALLRAHDRELVTEAVGEVLAAVRAEIAAAPDEAAAQAVDLSPEALARRAERHLQRRLRPRLRHVVNATGVVLHTNLGRSPLAEEAIEAIVRVAGRYNNLELDLATGERGSRYAHVEELLCRLTGAEAAMVVNNGAGAVLLMLSALCRDREVIVSRGELVEIGGSFRVPDVMVQGGARLVEVGTTNKTHLRDYENALRPETAAILKVHQSNFRVIGFTEAPPLADLAALAHRHGLPLLVDWGSGVMLDLRRLGLEPEVTMPELLAAGADLVTFSGDKLLGGPQGGFIVGRRSLVDRCRRHPLTRALRVDKLTLAGIEATLRLYLEPDRAAARIPILRMLALRPEDLQPVAEALAARIRQEAGDAVRVRLAEGFSAVGGGSLPGVEIPTVLVAVEPTGRPAHEVEAGLRAHEPPVLARVQRGEVLLDPRTLWPDEIPLVAAAVARAAGQGR
ncbi:L-seryl-tRNA(Sec) selenium transferase [Caldinitratiruptor microaerophilus]|uniref:L-seryl-tRNA(Sec) selenium transferase n=1 Tax=Caldinitratiruptor microaerophilus TaxID=671077 RepID=A0AA35G8B3_9FIRM|nr:L-seryl-tRNA(Sec) selenium transferase [Caldinitratiruptor microaerophilus]BDG60891.1 L-seryl-tRNA(Sec) selenium transferase [Caldinitratiruptor microaerophilus]